MPTGTRSVSPVDSQLSTNSAITISGSNDWSEGPDVNDGDSDHGFWHDEFRPIPPPYSEARDTLHKIRLLLQIRHPFLLVLAETSGGQLYEGDKLPLSHYLEESNEGADQRLKLCLLKVTLFHLTLTTDNQRDIGATPAHGEVDSPNEVQLWEDLLLSDDIHDVYTLGHHLLYQLQYNTYFDAAKFEANLARWRTLVAEYYEAPFHDTLADAMKRFPQ